MTEDRRDVLLKKLKSKKGRTAAINAKCCECIYDPATLGCGSWRKQVEDCTATDCPLYEYRPRSVAGKDEDDDNETEGEENGSEE